MTPAAMSDNRQKLITGDFKILENSLPEIVKELNQKTVFITGATGFFGKWVLYLLKKLNESHDAKITVVALSRDPLNFLNEYVEFDNLGWLKWGRYQDVSSELSKYKPDYILHFATENVDKNSNGLDLYLQSFVFNKIILDYMKENSKLTRLLLSSSGAIYGNLSGNHSLRAYTDPMDLTKSYAEIKRSSEHFFASLQGSSKFEFLSARCFAFAGPFLPLDKQFAIGNFVGNALKNEKIVIKSDGKSIRSYLYGADLALWLLIILTRGKKGEFYDVGSDERVSISELANRVMYISGKKDGVEVLGQPRSDELVDVYLPSLQKSFDLGCKVNFDLSYCIERMLKFNHENILLKKV